MNAKSYAIFFVIFFIVFGSVTSLWDVLLEGAAFNFDAVQTLIASVIATILFAAVTSLLGNRPESDS